MKKTQWTDALRNIRGNWVSFLSVLMISLLASVAYLGLVFSAEGLKKSAGITYQAGRTADLEITVPALLTGQDLETVCSVEGVGEAEGPLALPSLVQNGGKTLKVTLRTVPGQIRLPFMLEGRLPEAADECAVEKALADKMGYRTGDTVELGSRNPQSDMLIQQKILKVTGVFTLADHLTEMVPFEPEILVTRDAFLSSLLPPDRYTGLLVRLENPDPNVFSDAWKTSAEQLRERLEALDSSWIVTPLYQTAGYICTRENAGMLSTISVTFSMLFVLIAALVIYSTIGRLITRESKLVGAVKAMGLKNGEVFAKYLLFSVSAVLAGSALGFLIGYFVFEQMVLYFMETVYFFAERAKAFLPVPVLLMSAGAVLLGVVAAFLACRRLLRYSAVQLMSGQNGTRSLRKASSSGHGALYLRLMIRNMRTDWKRVLVSVISVAGSCMLLMIGFGLKFAISRAPDRQYGEIQRFDYQITVDPAAAPEDLDSIRSLLEEEGIPAFSVLSQEAPYEAGDESGLLNWIGLENEEDFRQVCSLTDPRSGNALAFPDSGVLVSRLFSEKYHLRPGDRFQVYDAAYNRHDVEIAGVFENYLGIPVFSSRATAEDCLGASGFSQAILVRLGSRDPEAVRQRLSAMDGFVSLTSSEEQGALFRGISGMLNLVILLMGFLAVMIACFILLNQVSTYVHQKKNELTIMRINGYTAAETIRYASLECYGITLLGILLGLVAGQLFSSWLFTQIEQLSASFVREPVWISFVASAAITAVISAVIHFAAFRKIRGLKLSDMS